MRTKISSLQKGLVLHMPLDLKSTGAGTQINDISSYHNHGTNVNGATFTTGPRGESNGAMAFDGLSNVIIIPNSDQLTFGDSLADSAFSISAWIKLNDSSYMTILAKGQSSTIGEFFFGTNFLGTLTFLLLDANTSNYIGRRYDAVSMSAYTGQWIFVVGTYNGSGTSNGIKIYFNLNNVDDADAILGAYTAMHVTTSTIRIGSRNMFSTQCGNGLIADVRIYNRVLTQDEITKLYTIGSQKLSIRPKVMYVPVGAEGYDSTGTKIIDLASEGWMHEYSGQVVFKTAQDYGNVNIHPGAYEVLVVAGGGGGGCRFGGGGGAGGLLYDNNLAVSGSSVSIIVGGGGLGATETGTYGGDGESSGLGAVVAIGGGGGGKGNTNNNDLSVGRDGGSGGGAGTGNTVGYDPNGGVGTGGQGYSGGKGQVGVYTPSGGGGGADGAGGDGANSNNVETNKSGDGGSGLTYFGYDYAGGGGGGAYTNIGTASHGGGNGGSRVSRNGVSGSAFTGGGGGGGGQLSSSPFTPGPGGNGGSGIIIIRWGGYSHNYDPTL